MAKWKITRDLFGDEEFNFNEGDEVTIGRGLNNKIVLTSSVVSRDHCVLNVQKDNIVLTDLKSSNGTYINSQRIPHHVPSIIRDSELIGIGWTFGAPIGKKGITEKVDDSEKYVFKLSKEKSLANRIRYQSENEADNLEHTAFNGANHQTSPKLSLKRKIDLSLNDNMKENNFKSKIIFDDDIISILSDSDNDCNKSKEPTIKKVKVEIITKETTESNETLNKLIKKEPIKQEVADFEYEALHFKQEYLGYDEPIEIDSGSDSESDQWAIRLSQSSPGKPFSKLKKNKEFKREEGSYSQLDDMDDLFNENDDYNDEDELDDLITLPPIPSVGPEKQQVNTISAKEQVDTIPARGQVDTIPAREQEIDEEDEFLDDLIRINLETTNSNKQSIDRVDGFVNQSDISNNKTPQSPSIQKHPDITKRIQMIEPLILQSKKKSHYSSKQKSKSSSKPSKVHKHYSSKSHISSSHKEERKKKLKELAEKEKEISKSDSSHTANKTINVKNSSSNRGAFLSDVAHAVVKPMKRKESPQKAATSKLRLEKEKSIDQQSTSETSEIDKERKEKSKVKSKKSAKLGIENKKRSPEKSKSKDRPKQSTKSLECTPVLRVPLKSLKPLTDSEESHSGKPFSKVGPLSPKKPKKKVRFSEAPPQIREFEIEDGNKMKRTSSIHKLLVDIQQKPVFSLEKITLMKILRWNPHWLDEQVNNNDPPPILGHNNIPMAIFHSFNTHHQYVQMIGDLLLMEIWERLTQAYLRIRNQSYGIKMRIGSIPPAPSPDRCLDLFCIGVNVSLPKTDLKNLPRTGEIMHVHFGPETARNSRFFLVHNVRTLPSPPNNIYSFFSISLQATFTEKMKSLTLGGEMTGRSLAYINNELMLFEAMEYLAGSPLSEAILRPDPRHFARPDTSKPLNINSQWTSTLNESQRRAVRGSVEAALGDKPSIQMVQGPPGTGKSSVICAIVMTYLYDSAGRRQAGRDKILVCATSNAAVDELVIRLLHIRQNLPKSERFRMVRVGRVEAMHSRARDVSSQQLAQRDAARLADPHVAGAAEISHLEAKMNMWKTQALDAKDPVRVAYCQTRIQQIASRIALMTRGAGKGGGEGRGEGLGAAEKRIIEGADIIVTTLASATNYKMHGLKRHIALCIVDEAGQAIEPETLIPLTLCVTKLTLIGDPQQLPGFIYSQRAKTHGLGESLFSRLTSNSELWKDASPVVLLNQQYRMHPEIADYPNRAFYGGRIQSMTLYDSPLNIAPYTILSISSGDKGQGASGANESEACGVSRLAAALLAATRRARLTLACITPYNAHKDAIKRNLRLLHESSECQIEVNTVDSFQGQERDVVIVSLARSQGVGFLTDAGRMNVMLTRAKRALLVCLNPHAMLKHPQWRTLVEDAQRRNMYKELPNKMCQPVTAPEDQTACEDILKYIV